MGCGTLRGNSFGAVSFQADWGPWRNTTVYKKRVSNPWRFGQCDESAAQQ